MKAFANLATISDASLKLRLTCTGSSNSQRAAYQALSRHADKFHNCGKNGVDFSCWSEIIRGEGFDLGTLNFFQNWCKK